MTKSWRKNNDFKVTMQTVTKKKKRKTKEVPPSPIVKIILKQVTNRQYCIAIDRHLLPGFVLSVTGDGWKVLCVCVCVGGGVGVCGGVFVLCLFLVFFPLSVFQDFYQILSLTLYCMFSD